MVAPPFDTDLNDSVLQHLHQDFTSLRVEQTVGQALASIRERQPQGRIIYFYVVDSEGRLKGVVPTRRLLLTPLERPIADIMVPQVIAIPATATVLDACEFFTLHRLLAFPVVDAEKRILGIVDVQLYTDELRDLERREGHDDLFQLIGVHLTEAQQANPVVAFRQRFPWLLANIAGGLLAALLVLPVSTGTGLARRRAGPLRARGAGAGRKRQHSVGHPCPPDASWETAHLEDTFNQGEPRAAHGWSPGAGMCIARGFGGPALASANGRRSVSSGRHPRRRGHCCRAGPGDPLPAAYSQARPAGRRRADCPGLFGHADAPRLFQPGTLLTGVTPLALQMLPYLAYIHHFTGMGYWLSSRRARRRLCTA